MTQTEANNEMLKIFEGLIERTEKEGLSNSEFVELADSAHKLYITLNNAGVFAKEQTPGKVTMN